MPWCDDCGSEYRDEFEYCPICNTRLRAAPPATQPTAAELVLLTKLETSVQMAQLRGLLADADIPSVCREWGAGQMVRIVTGCVSSMTGADLYVDVRDLSRAQELLTLLRDADTPQALDVDAAYDAYMAESAALAEPPPAEETSYRTLIGLLCAIGAFILLVWLMR